MPMDAKMETILSITVTLSISQDPVAHALFSYNMLYILFDLWEKTFPFVFFLWCM